VTIGAVTLAAGCGGFVSRCSDDQECIDAPYSYCNIPLGACFKRTGGSAVPNITRVDVDGGNITVSGDAPPQSRISVFPESDCAGPASETNTAAAEIFSVVVVDAGFSGMVSAYSENVATGSLSVCSPNVGYP
jgi:hypothetical protein